jgi:hypothetical protein
MSAIVKTVKAEDIKPGMAIRNGRRWYAVVSITDPGRPLAFDALVTDAGGAGHSLGIWRGGDYLVKEG